MRHDTGPPIENSPQRTQRAQRKRTVLKIRMGAGKKKGNTKIGESCPFFFPDFFLGVLGVLCGEFVMTRNPF
jgi:hypothetical protein